MKDTKIKQIFIEKLFNTFKIKNNILKDKEEKDFYNIKTESHKEEGVESLYITLTSLQEKYMPLYIIVNKIAEENLVCCGQLVGEIRGTIKYLRVK